MIVVYDSKLLHAGAQENFVFLSFVSVLHLIFLKIFACDTIFGQY